MKPDQILPRGVRAVLWSYDPDRLDLSLHKRLIISQVLNFGTEEATAWLFQNYGAKTVIAESNQIPLGQWDRKSLSLWSLVLGITPTAKSLRVQTA